MPTYAYACTACSHEFEVVQSITDTALAVCPECGGSLRKVFHPVGVAFKGSGFYRTDSRASTPGGKKSDGADSGGKTSKDAASTSSGSTSSAPSEGSSKGSAAKPSTTSSGGTSSTGGSSG